MISQILCECKKVLRNCWIWVIFLGVIVFSSFVNVHNRGSWIGYREDGSLIQDEEAMDYEREILQSYEGEMNAAWFTRLHQDVREAQKEDVLLRADHEKMQMVYGDDWLAHYMENAESYMQSVQLEVDVEHSSTIPILYVKDTFKNGNLLEYSALQTLAHGYASFVEEKQWNLGMRKEDSKEAYWTRNLTEKEKEKVIDDVNSMSAYSYGETSGWKEVFNNMEGAYFVFPIFLIILTSNMFNKEMSSNMVEILKTSRYGKRKAAFAKLYAGIALTMMFTCILLLWFFLSAYLRYGLGNWNVLLSEIMQNAMSPFTVKDAILGGIWIISIGALVVSMTSMLFSCILKSPYLSLILSAVIFILPAFLRADIVQLFPIHFMAVWDVFTSIETFSVLGSLYYLAQIIWIWLFPMLVFGIICISYYSAYRFIERS